MRQFLLCLIFCSVKAFAWWDTPHMLVAQIAYEKLTPEVRQKADDLIARHAEQYPESSNFITASLWADDIRAQGDKTYSSWHYVTLTFKEQGDPQPTRENFPEKYHVAWAVEHEVKLLKNPMASQDEKALALRRLIHWVGDIHQPSHATTHIAPQYPKGDNGGNLFLLAQDKPFHNLHSYWDSGLRHWPSVDRPLDREGELYLLTEAKRLQDFYGQVPLGSLNPYDWALDSHSLGRDYAYTGIEYKGVPSPEYTVRGSQLTDAQVTLAGRRLAELLNDAL
jgi:hypothetical protein